MFSRRASDPRVQHHGNEYLFSGQNIKIVAGSNSSKYYLVFQNPINLQFIGIRSETRINKGHPNSTDGELRIKASNLIPRDESLTRVLPPTGRRRIVTTPTELKEQVDGDYEDMEEPVDEEYSEDNTSDNAARVSYDEEVKNAWQRAHKVSMSLRCRTIVRRSMFQYHHSNRYFFISHSIIVLIRR